MLQRQGQWLFCGYSLFVCVCGWVGVSLCMCAFCRFCSTCHTTLGSLVLPVINTGLKSPTVTRLPYCLFCPRLNNELAPPSNAVVTLFVAARDTHTHTHTHMHTHADNNVNPLIVNLHDIQTHMNAYVYTLEHSWTCAVIFL